MFVHFTHCQSDGVLGTAAFSWVTLRDRAPPPRENTKAGMPTPVSSFF